MFRRLAIAAALAALILSSCATLVPPQSREFKLSEAQLQDLVGKHFATAQRYLGVFDVKLTTPRVSLQPESNRVLTALDVAPKVEVVNDPAVSERPIITASLSGMPSRTRSSMKSTNMMLMLQNFLSI